MGPSLRIPMVALACALLATPTSAAPRDAYFYLAQINKASAVMVVETGIVSPALGARIADALGRVTAAADAPGGPRPRDYLLVEKALIAVGGPDVTRLHSGRSRQDIGATSERLAERDLLLDAFGALNGTREALLAWGGRNPDAILPAYTWGVQAQPITLGHYVTAYAAALTREADRMREAYRRLNLSPLGAAALGTSSFPVDRALLAQLLGFAGPLGNSLDANQIAPIDTGAELAGLASAGALTLGAMLADVTAQYGQTRPWIVMTEGDLTGVSSIMPQKRNPAGLVRLRAEASTLVGTAETVLLLAHNVPSGMSDYKDFGNPRGEPLGLLRDLGTFLGHAEALIRTLRFDPERALDEVNADYSTTTELADVLQREADVPFRIGHHFASELVTFGRAEHLRPAAIPFEAAQRIYAEVASVSGADPILPLTVEQFRRALAPENMVASSRGLGGPQPAEVARMLALETDRLGSDRAWLAAERERLAAAEHRLDDGFAALRAPPAAAPSAADTPVSASRPR